MYRPSHVSPLLLGPVLLALAASPLRAQPPPPEEAVKELREARRAGWQLASLTLQALGAGDQTDYPGIQAFLKDVRAVSKEIDPASPPKRAPVFDADALVTRNPNFWRASYEIAPGDPALLLLHAGLLLGGGEATRASHVAVVALQRPGVPKELRQGFDILLANTQRAGRKSNELVAAGIKLHDRGDYPGALGKYREALAAWPQNGFAHYELGLTLRHQELAAAGEKPPPADAVIVNDGKKASPQVASAFAAARRHDPFQVKAYQGDDREVIKGFLALAKTGFPAWQALVKDHRRQARDGVLEDLAVACQAANHHELALVARQVLVARRGRYAPVDHPFIAASLRKLAPGEQAEAALQLLGSGNLRLRQLAAPDGPR
jgi:hypothetical protein